MFEINFETEKQKVNTIEDGTRRELDSMPCDHGFWIDEDNYELCHATGYEVAFDDEWWNEYTDSECDFHYGR